MSKLASDLSPFEYNACVNAATKALVSIQMIFADKMGKSLVNMPRVGPEITTQETECITEKFENRGAARDVSIFLINGAVSGLGISYPALVEDGEEILIKLGRASIDLLRIQLNEEFIIRGLYGASTPNEITQLGLVIENIACTMEEAKKLEEAERLR